MIISWGNEINFSYPSFIGALVKKSLSDEERLLLNKAITERFTGEGPEKIAKEFGLSINTVRTFASKLKVPTRKMKEGEDKSNFWNEKIREFWGKKDKKEISTLLGISVSAVVDRARKLGFTVESRIQYSFCDRSQERIRHREIQKAVKLRYQKEGALPIAAEFSVSPRRVMSIARRLGVKVDSWHARTAKTKRLKYPNCNAKAFEDPVTADSAYYLGLIQADGSLQAIENKLYTLAITLTQFEWPLLDYLADFLKVKGHRYGPFRRENYHKWQSIFSIANKDLVLSLLRRGLTPNKSFLDNPHLQGIPDSLYHHFARGVLDGDGSISYSGDRKTTPYLAWYGTLDFVNTLQDKISTLAGVKRREVYPCHKTESNKTFGVMWACKEDTEKLMNWLHQDGGVYATRKHDPYLVQLGKPLTLIPVPSREPRTYSWGSILPDSGEERERIVEDSFLYYQKYGFPYPDLSEESRKENWLALKSLDPSSVWIDDVTLNLSKIAHRLPTHYHQSIWDTRSKGCFAPKELFNDPSSLKAVLYGRTWRGRGTYPAQLLQGLRMCGMHPTNFPPGVAKAVIKRLLPVGGNVLDPCSGWSSRMLAALSLDNICYWGIEPATKTFEESSNLLKDPIFLSEARRVKLFNQAYEDCLVDGKRDFFDLIFTSPPYHNKEAYGRNEENQVRFRFPTWEQFSSQWIPLFLLKSLDLLKKQGYLALVTADTKDQLLTKAFRDKTVAGLSLVFAWKRKIQIRPGRSKQKFRYEDITVWQKN